MRLSFFANPLKPTSILVTLGAILGLTYLPEAVQAQDSGTERSSVSANRSSPPKPSRQATKPANKPPRSGSASQGRSGSAGGTSIVRKAKPPAPRSTYAITRINTSEKVVALTYDDGPFPAFTPRFLEILNRKGVKGTFFMCGNMVKAHPELARRVREEGHELANHSYNHPLLTKLSAEGVRNQLSQTNDLLQVANGGQPITLMRPPYGGRNAMVDEVCRQLGLKVILWDVDTNDWRKRSAAQITDTVLNNTRPGSIVLFHDRLQGSLDAQVAIIDGLRARGYRFVTVGELLAMEKKPIPPSVLNQQDPTAATISPLPQ